MNKIFFIIIIINFVLAASQLVFSSLLATEGDQVRMLSVKKTETTEENIILEDQIFRFSSLSYVEQRAIQIGMIPAKLYTLSQAAIADARSSVP